MPRVTNWYWKQYEKKKDKHKLQFVCSIYTSHWLTSSYRYVTLFIRSVSDHYSVDFLEKGECFNLNHSLGCLHYCR